MNCVLVADVMPPWIKAVGERAGVKACTVGQLKELPRDVKLLVRWGVTGGSDSRFVRVINRQTSLRIAYNSKIAAHRLRLNGLQPMTRKSTIGRPGVRLYRVEIFDLEPLAIRRMIFERGHWHFRLPTRISERESQRAVSAAIRAVHALGLDAGRVDVVLLPATDGLLREGVCTVNPAPDWSGPVAQRMAAAIRRLRQSGGMPAEKHYLLGADPELAFIEGHSERLVPASEFLSLRGEVGCDSQTAPGQSNVRPLAELRPQPRSSPEQLVAELHRCFRLLADKVTDRSLIWRAGSTPGHGYGIGGHIHFSGLRLTGPLLRALDNYLAVPVMLVEPSYEAVARRRRHGYLGDVRFKPHGGFEYRTLPSWLVSPDLARAVLSLAACIASDYPSLVADLFGDTEMVEAFYQADKEPFYSVVDRLLTDLSATESFNRYQAYIEPLFELIARRQTWNSRADLRQVWQVSWEPHGEDPQTSAPPISAPTAPS